MNCCPETATRGDEIVLVGAEAGFARCLDASLIAAGLPFRIRQASVAGVPPEARPALVIIDLDRCNDLNVIDRSAKAAPVLAVASGTTVRLAVEVVRRGAVDLLARPISEALLATALRRILGEPAAAPRDPLDALIGSSEVMDAVRSVIRNAATSAAPVFIHGESGTGKELCAEAIHRLSPRADGPLIALNCSAIPRDLMESEIFGHERGAFTGAAGARDGAALLADGGTLFLDEICEMDLDLQAKLLRFAQTGMVLKVGGGTARKVDVRIVCATNRDPHEAVRSGRFRADLFYRLHVLPVALPPLRERGGDAIEIAERMLPGIAAEEGRRFRGLDGDARRLIVSHGWPGNVRELINVLRNVVVMNDGDEICGTMLALALAYGDRSGDAPAGGGTVIGFPAGPTAEPVDIRPLKLQERDIIEAAVAACHGNVAEAAARLGINASTIYRKRQAWTAGTA